MNIFFWQDIPSHIQSPAIVELARQWQGQVSCVWTSGITDDRQDLCWSVPDMPGVQQHYFDQRAPRQFVEKILADSKDAIHIFSGLDSYPPISMAFGLAKQAGFKRLGLMAESGIKLGWRGKLRPLRAKLLARKYIGAVRLVLAMGQTGVQFYRRAGFSNDVLFPYIYQSPVNPVQRPNAASEQLEIVYVGKFVRRKGLDVLLKAVALSKTTGIQLRIIGGGVEETELRRLSRQLEIENRVRWDGVRDHQQVLTALSQADICVVPSRFEGWGVVVNESIGMGTPVICSDETASCELVTNGQCGRVFRNQSARDLAAKLDELLQPNALVTARENAIKYCERITPHVIASYLHDVLKFRFCQSTDRPSPPWVALRPNSDRVSS